MQGAVTFCFSAATAAASDAAEISLRTVAVLSWCNGLIVGLLYSFTWVPENPGTLNRLQQASNTSCKLLLHAQPCLHQQHQHDVYVESKLLSALPKCCRIVMAQAIKSSQKSPEIADSVSLDPMSWQEFLKIVVCMLACT